MILKAFIWISQHGPGGADVSDGPALRFALNARPTASQGEAPATAIGNMGRGQREESSAKGRRVGDSQSNLPALKKKRLHKILDKCRLGCVWFVPAAPPLAATEHGLDGVPPTGPINRLKLCICCKSSALACG